jgi:hypothetical protein
VRIAEGAPDAALIALIRAATTATAADAASPTSEPVGVHLQLGLEKLPAAAALRQPALPAVEVEFGVDER